VDSRRQGLTGWLCTLSVGRWLGRRAGSACRRGFEIL